MNYISEIEKLMIAKSEGYVHECELLLSKLCSSNNLNVISQLSQLFRDDCDDELMFSIVHCMEQFADDEYIGALIPVLPVVYQNSPRWSSILIIRILNNPDTARHLKEYLDSMEDKYLLLDVAKYACKKWSNHANSIKETFQIADCN